jgi:hypothetical protein
MATTERDTRITSMEARLAEAEARLGRLEARIGELEEGKKDKRRFQPPKTAGAHPGGTGPVV